MPRDAYFIGNLRPRQVAVPSPDEPEHLQELLGKLAPIAMGAEFLLRIEAEEAQVDVEVTWACYYRALPTLEQQRQHLATLAHTQADAQTAPSPGPQVPGKLDRADKEGDAESAASGEDETTDDDRSETAADRRRHRHSQDTLFMRFKKIACKATGRVVVRKQKGNVIADQSRLIEAIREEMMRASHTVLADPDRLRVTGAVHTRVQVPEAALASRADYEHFLASLIVEIAPTWSLEVSTDLRVDSDTPPDAVIVRFEFVNSSPTVLDPKGKESSNVDAFLFDVGARFAILDSELIPFDLELAPRGFRYDRSLWGRGFNCAVELVSRSPSSLSTTHTPMYRQGRFATGTEPGARFSDLAADPKVCLESVQAAMKGYLKSWDEARVGYEGTIANWATEFEAEFLADRARFELETERFASGSRLILADPDVRLAFRLTNEAFRRAGMNPNALRRKESWRLFQLVFLVNQVPGIWALAHPDSPEAAQRSIVDIIYFPTGGGKTEAYLAVVVFHCFFDRLRGKTHGVTAWTRFPLRLLTLQQTQRVVDVVGIAEIIRREHSDARLSGPSVGEFAVGYFVGKDGSPNELINPALFKWDMREDDQVTWARASDAHARQGWKRITRCPSCRTSRIRLDVDADRSSLVHRCLEADCRFPSGRIPFYIVDNDLYRYLPSVIVGTIDKLAGIGNQRKLAQLFGQVDGRCSVHGFYKAKCPQKDCYDLKRLNHEVPEGISGPTLFVQDELHLLKEGLGTFDSHYESFAQVLRREFGASDSLKVIASSATIEAFERQVQHLYGRSKDEAAIFPGLGPRLGESFYAHTTEQPQRLYVGILPHNKTIFNAILELVEFYHKEVQALAVRVAGKGNPFGGPTVPASAAWKGLLDGYVTSVNYFLAARELSSLRTDIESHVNPIMVRSGMQAINIFELTGDTGSDEVTRVLDIIETGSTQLLPTTVLATSMISHGVDVDRLNHIVFFGMPRQTSEYIQSSSRIGRSHVGIVFTCLHPARERDRSHYTYFTKYHEFLGKLVEPVAINRWATFSIQRTLPGLFMAVLLQVIANRSGGPKVDSHYKVDFVKQRIADRSIQIETFFSLLEEAYLVQGGDPTGLALFRAEIRDRVPRFFDQIVSAGPDKTWVSDVLIPRPMNSLRDVDEQVPIELNTFARRWAKR
jgi:hypothetical protein